VTVLGLGQQNLPSGEAEASFRSGWVRHFRLALSSAGGAALVVGFFELLQRQPAESFRLLGQWGPWPVIALVALVLLGSFLSRMNDTVQTTFGSIVSSVQQQAQSSGKTADALSRLAEQGGRQAEEVRRLAIYAGRELGSIGERLDKQDIVLEKLASSVQGLHTRFDGAQRRNDEGRRD